MYWGDAEDDADYFAVQNCLNPDFHMPCVGLTKRSQKWYCSKCDKEKA